MSQLETPEHKTRFTFTIERDILLVRLLSKLNPWKFGDERWYDAVKIFGKMGYKVTPNSLNSRVEILIHRFRYSKQTKTGSEEGKTKLMNHVQELVDIIDAEAVVKGKPIRFNTGEVYNVASNSNQSQFQINSLPGPSKRKQPLQPCYTASATNSNKTGELQVSIPGLSKPSIPVEPCYAVSTASSNTTGELQASMPGPSKASLQVEPCHNVSATSSIKTGELQTSMPGPNKRPLPPLEQKPTNAVDTAPCAPTGDSKRETGSSNSKRVRLLIELLTSKQDHDMAMDERRMQLEEKREQRLRDENLLREEVLRKQVDIQLEQLRIQRECSEIVNKVLNRANNIYID